MTTKNRENLLYGNISYAIRGLCSVFNSKKAFTLIELLVVVAVMILLSSVLIGYSHLGERQIILFKEQAKLINILSRAKSLSVVGFGESTENFPCGYGIYFEAPRTFIIFKDLSSGDDCSMADKKYSGTDELFESFILNSTLEFGELTFSDIIFIPPEPLVVITPIQDQAVITIKIVNTNDSKTIKINNAGQISTQ